MCMYKITCNYICNYMYIRLCVCVHPTPNNRALYKSIKKISTKNKRKRNSGKDKKKARWEQRRKGP